MARYARSLEVAGAFVATGPPSYPAIVAPPPPPAPAAPPPPPAPAPPAPGPLTGKPHHHSIPETTEEQILNIRAEGLLTQALVFAIAERAGIDARGLYDSVRNGF
jgi:hypothetical protein